MLRDSACLDTIRALLCPVTLLSTAQPLIHMIASLDIFFFHYGRAVSLKQNSVLSGKTELGLINLSFFLQFVWSLQSTKAHRLCLGRWSKHLTGAQSHVPKFYNLLCLKVRGWEEKRNNKSKSKKKKKKKENLTNIPSKVKTLKGGSLAGLSYILPLQSSGRELGLLTASL